MHPRSKDFSEGEGLEHEAMGIPGQLETLSVLI
jgi:hypothetical protein